MHYFSYINSKWFRQTHQYYTIIRIFQSLLQFWTNCQIITICHHLMTCCNFGTSHEYLYSYIGIFRFNRNNFHWHKIDLIQVLLTFNNDYAKWILYYTNIRYFQSLLPVLDKLPDHHNRPVFDDMLQFWYQSWVSLFVFCANKTHQD